MTTEDPITAKVMSGESWNAFCDSLKSAGQVILRPETPATPLDRAEGFRYLSRLTRIALEMLLENGDPDFPAFFQASHTTAKIGADNPDNSYLNATIAGDRTYRIRGVRGTVPYLSFATNANRYATDGTLALTGELDGRNMKFDADGRFELIISREKQPGNWLPMVEDSSLLVVRQTFLDRPRETAITATIECVNRPAKPTPLSPLLLDKGLQGAAAFVRGTAHTFVEWTELFRRQPNVLDPLDQSMFIKGGGDRNIHYIHGYWALAPDEALVIETEVPECEIWNFQLDNYWMESLDYRFLPANWNKHTARYNPDKSVTFVIAAADPGIGNFMDTAGHTTGTLLLRWTRAKHHPVPRCKVVPLASLMTSGS